MADTTDNILKTYNSIARSRTRWVQNRNELRNKWPELFVALEQGSGRDGHKLDVYDPNWHIVTTDEHGQYIDDRPARIDAEAEAKKANEKPAASPKK